MNEMENDVYMEITVEDWFKLYKKHTFEFKPGLTCLIGKNGSGKTTLLLEMKEWFNSKKIEYYYYQNEESEKFNMR